MQTRHLKLENLHMLPRKNQKTETKIEKGKSDMRRTERRDGGFEFIEQMVLMCITTIVL